MTGELEVATFKNIERSKIDRSTPNYGSLDEGRYKPDSPEVLALKAALMSAGNGEQAVIINPILVTGSEKEGYVRINGERRLLCLDLLESEGKNVPTNVSALILTKNQASDPNYVKRISLMLDTTQEKLSAFAEATALYEQFLELRETLRAEDGSALTDAQVKAHIYRLQGIDPEAKGSDFRVAQEKLNSVIRMFAEVPESWISLCQRGILSIRAATRGLSLLQAANKELASLEACKFSFEDIIENFAPGGWSEKELTDFLNAAIRAAKLEVNRDKILKGLPEEVVEAVANNAMDLEAADTLKREAKQKDIDPSELFAVACEISQEEQPVSAEDILIAVDSFEVVEEKPVTLEDINQEIKLLKRLLSGQIDTSFNQAEIDTAYSIINGAKVKLDRLFNKNAKRIAKEEKESVQEEAATPDAA